MDDLNDALDKAEGMLEWSQRIGSDEKHELGEIIKSLQKAKANFLNIM